MAEPDTEQAARDMKASAREEASRAGEHVAGEAKAIAGEAADLGREHAERRFEQGKETVGGEVRAVGSALDDAAQRLHERDSPLASYADEIAGQISRFSSTLESTSLEDLATRTRRLARENPGLFVAGSVIAGIAASRFFKASDERSHGSGGGYPGGDGGRPDGGYGYRGAYDGTGSGDRNADYLEGRRAALSGHVPDYRSPLASRSTPHRDEPDGTSAARVPMDSTATAGTSASSPTPSSAGTDRPAGAN